MGGGGQVLFGGRGGMMEKEAVAGGMGGGGGQKNGRWSVPRGYNRAAVVSRWRSSLIPSHHAPRPVRVWLSLKSASTTKL